MREMWKTNFYSLKYIRLTRKVKIAISTNQEEFFFDTFYLRFRRRLFVFNNNNLNPIRNIGTDVIFFYHFYLICRIYIYIQMILVVWFQPNSRIPAWRDTRVILAVHLVNYKVHYLVDVIRQTWIRTQTYVQRYIPSWCWDLAFQPRNCLRLSPNRLWLIAINSNFHLSARLGWKQEVKKKEQATYFLFEKIRRKTLVVVRRSGTRKFKRLSSIQERKHTMQTRMRKHVE